MSKYTYYISLNGSDYSAVTPANAIRLRGYWEGDTHFDRYEINELKLCAKNNSVYTTLESWSTDPTKYTTEVLFRIDKNSVVWKYFVFGIRWATFDKQTQVMTVKPQPYDGYYKYFSPYIDMPISEISPTYGNWIPSLNYEMHYDVYNYDASNKPYSSTLDPDTFATWQCYKIWDVIETIISNLGIGVDIKSSLLNNDTSTVLPCPEAGGVVLDYVTGRENVFINAGIKFQNVSSYTLETLFKLLEIFQIYPFFEDGTTLRLEHVKYIDTELTDNAVSLTPDEDENKWQYIDQYLPVSETFKLYEDQENTDEDFHCQVIKYSLAQTGMTRGEISNNYFQFTDIAKYISSSADYEGYDLIIAGTWQHVEEFTNDGGNINVDLKNDFEYIELSASPTLENILSNDIRLNDTYANSQFNCFVYLDADCACTACFKDRSSGATISNTFALSNGNNSFTLTSLGGSNTDAAFCIYFTPAQFDSVSGYATVRTVYNATYPKPYRLAIEPGAVTGDNTPNSPFSQANIINNWWQTNRPSNSATINGTPVQFEDSQYSIRRELKPRYYGSDVNMRYGINDGVRIAKIESYERDLDTDFVTFTLIYKEDE